MTDLDTHLKNRALMASALAGEIFGPNSSLESKTPGFMPETVELNITQQVGFASWDEYNRNHVVMGSGQEILKDETPTAKYGLGILFPEAEGAEANAGRESEGDNVAQEALRGMAELEDESATRIAEKTRQRNKLLERAEKVSALAKGEEDSGVDLQDEDGDLRLSNLRRPRCMGVSFIADLQGEGVLAVQLDGGRYQRIEASVTTSEDREPVSRLLWARHVVQRRIEISFERARSESKIVEEVVLEGEHGLPSIRLAVELVSRPIPEHIREDYSDDCRLLTASVVNRTKGRPNELALFQTRMTIIPTAKDGNPCVLEYPRPSLSDADDETQSFELLYRNERTFSTGHGCAGDWDADEYADRARTVTAEPLPFHETPSITPNLQDGDKILKIPMSPLAGLVEGDDGFSSIKRMLELYEKWINDRASEIGGLQERFKEAAKRHLDDCQIALERMRAGLDLINSDSTALKAFQLANRAMLIQQICGSFNKRIRNYDRKEKRWHYDREYREPDLTSETALERSWRPFQIAFILMNIPTLFNRDDTSRELVDLIWFPTGGGKTEAYLGAAAYSLFVRRLRNAGDMGTEILMRYTLRLLTAQQFQRASGLICAMESIRRDMPEVLGGDPFSIGIWVGGETTPNSISDARVRINDTRRFGQEKYPLVLLRCPWCGTEIGPKEDPNKGKKKYLLQGVNTADLKLFCPERNCQFHAGLPVWAVDEQIYNERPSLVIGTVDKFASLAWKPAARSVFGIENDGTRLNSPPGIIIQDELHLITGPLGSMVGLYETVIEELCTDRRDETKTVKPKIICATATTRASNRQILDLFGRKKASIFPPPGFDAGDSFFAKYDRDTKTGKRNPGRMYLGVLPVNYSSALTASVRSFSAVITAAGMMPDDQQKNPWWTLLVFYNSLRELGGGLTLFASDIPERLSHVQRRWCKKGDRRWLNRVIELTGRLSNSEVPMALEDLEKSVGQDRYPVDACLASNIIEVGVDVNRLGIMSVMGQPKTSAQYIQATGRIGRELPGMVFTLYGSTKPRDRSHYEQFRSYHSRLYSQVEPSSVTPFSRPLLERAAHAILCAWVRQTMPLDEIDRPIPCPADRIKEAMMAMISRQRLLASRDKTREEVLHEEKMLKVILQRRAGEWSKSVANCWDKWRIDPTSGDQPLLRAAGVACKPEWFDEVWSTPTSMRGVDMETTPIISDQYRNPDDEADSVFGDFFTTLD